MYKIIFIYKIVKAKLKPSLKAKNLIKTNRRSDKHEYKG